MSTAPSKSKLRKSLLQSRLSLSPSQWREKSDRLCSHLQAALPFVPARCILAYFSVRQEPDLGPLFGTTIPQWGFSRTVGKSLIWHLWQVGEPIETNNYQILQPLPSAPRLEPHQVDLILIPALACDRRGYRLGYGGGFYDRLLATPAWQNIPTVGILFHFALLETLPVDPWDQSLAGVCTEEGYFPSLS